MKTSLIVSLGLGGILLAVVLLTAVFTRCGHQPADAGVTAEAHRPNPAMTRLIEQKFEIAGAGVLESRQRLLLNVLLFQNLAYEFQVRTAKSRGLLSLVLRDEESQVLKRRSQSNETSCGFLFTPSQSGNYTLMILAEDEEFTESQYALGKFVNESGVATSAEPVQPAENPPVDEDNSLLFAPPSEEVMKSAESIIPPVTDLYILMSEAGYRWQQLVQSDRFRKLMPDDPSQQVPAFSLGSHIAEAFMFLEIGSAEGCKEILSKLQDDTKAMGMDRIAQQFSGFIAKYLYEEDMEGLRKGIHYLQAELENGAEQMPSEEVIRAKVGAWSRALYSLIEGDIERGFLNEASAQRFRDQGLIAKLFLKDQKVVQALSPMALERFEKLASSLYMMEASNLNDRDQVSSQVLQFAHHLEVVIKEFSRQER